MQSRHVQTARARCCDKLRHLARINAELAGMPAHLGAGTSGWGGIRTHETVLLPTRSPGVRLKPLGHPSKSGKKARPSLTEGVGFEPTRPFRVNALAGRRLKPLGHPSLLPSSALNCRLESLLPRQGSNLDSSDPESDVLPVTPRGIQSDYNQSRPELHPFFRASIRPKRATGRT